MEFVYVVPRGTLFPDHYPHGFQPFGSEGVACPARDALGRALQDGFFVERAYAERTPALKQLIPYCLVVCDGRILLVRRTKRGGEARLHDKHSIGIGGHINPEDVEGRDGIDAVAAGTQREIDVVAAGTQREISEELDVKGTYEVRRVGLLNDDSNPVGAVHVGVVQLVVVQGSVEIREKDALEGRLIDPKELVGLRASGANFETWSSMLVDRLPELLRQEQPVFA